MIMFGTKHCLQGEILNKQDKLDMIQDFITLQAKNSVEIKLTE